VASSGTVVRISFTAVLGRPSAAGALRLGVSVMVASMVASFDSGFVSATHPGPKKG
jgi:hypothetical protein